MLIAAPASSRKQYRILAAVGAVTLAFTAAAFFLDADVFRPYLGAFNPVVAVALALLLGAASAILLMRRDVLRFYVDAMGSLLAPFAIGVGFGAVLVPLDAAFRLPGDLNIAPPVSVLFYPALATVVEILFHLLPLAVLCLVFEKALFRGADVRRLRIAAFAIVSLIEPIFQTLLPYLSDYSPVLRLIVAVYSILFNVVPLALARKRGFSAMLAFRVGQYLLWHVLWGALRLSWNP